MARLQLWAWSSLVLCAWADILELPIWVRNSYATVQVEIGTPPQVHVLYFDTGSSTSWLDATTCGPDDCLNYSGYPRSPYNQSASSTASAVGTSDSIGYLGGGVVGPILSDTFSIPSVRNHAPHWTQTFLSANESSWEDLPADGFLGLAFSTIASPGSTTVMETLMQLSPDLIAEPRFAIYYGRNLNDTGAGPGDGELTLGGSHEDRFAVNGDLTWIPVELEFAEFELWRANAVSIVGSTGIGSTSGASNTSTDFGFAWAVFDTGAGQIAVPPSFVDAVYESIGMNYSEILSGHVKPLCADFDDSWSLTFMLGDETNPTPLTITGTQLQQPGFAGEPQYCWPPVSSSGNDGLVLIGSPFLQQFYTVFDFGSFDVQSYRPRVGVGELQREWKPQVLNYGR